MTRRTIGIRMLQVFGIILLIFVVALPFLLRYG